MELSQSENPYAPPTSDVNAGQDRPPAEGALAPRLTRLAAAIVDGLLYVAAVMPAVIVGLQSGAVREGGSAALFRTFAGSWLGAISGVAWLVLVLFQAYLVATTGQSIAKRWFWIKIVKTDGSSVTFLSGVLVRNWLMMVIAQIPGVKMVLPFADALFIFRQDRRCIHDLLAGTKVIRLAGPTGKAVT